MKVIRANDVKIEANPTIPDGKHARKLVMELVRIDSEHLQYVKAEKEENLLACHMWVDFYFNLFELLK